MMIVFSNARIVDKRDSVICQKIKVIINPKHYILMLFSKASA